MKIFIQKNWFKISILLILIIALYGYFFINSNKPIIENSKVVSTFTENGNVFIKYQNDKAKQVTFSGLDEQPSLSYDLKKIVFLRNIPGKVYINESLLNDVQLPGLVGSDKNGDYVNLGQIFILDLDDMSEQKIFDSGIVKDKYIKNGKKFTDVFDIISFINNSFFSIDNNKIYFKSAAWATSEAVFSVDVNTEQMAFISDGNSLNLIKEGSFTGNLLISKHKYFKDANGSYDHYFVIDDNGQEIKDVGNFSKTPEEILSSLK
jgi:hypothetical protein